MRSIPAAAGDGDCLSSSLPDWGLESFDRGLLGDRIGKRLAEVLNFA